MQIDINKANDVQASKTIVLLLFLFHFSMTITSLSCRSERSCNAHVLLIITLALTK